MSPYCVGEGGVGECVRLTLPIGAELAREHRQSDATARLLNCWTLGAKRGLSKEE